MKGILLVAIDIIFTASFAFAQNRISNDTLYSNSGFTVVKGQILKIGEGSGIDGDFKYIRRNSSGFGTAMMATNSYSYNKEQFSLPRNMNGHQAEVVKLVERGTKKTGYTYEPLITLGASGRYEIDIDPAITSGEIIVPDEFKPKPKSQVVIVNNVSVADELTKLKKLLADSVITQEEYNEQKKKLLSK